MLKIDSTAEAHDYKNLVDLLAVYSEASNRMLSLQAGIQEQYLELIDGAKDEYATLQSKLGDAEQALEALSVAHPEWFPEKKKSIKTPYGIVKLTATTKLDAPNEEVSILLIQQAGEEAAEKFLRIHTELNIEALEALPDAELKPFRIKRVKDQSFSVTPAKLDMGKAVKEALGEAAPKKNGKAVAA